MLLSFTVFALLSPLSVFLFWLLHCLFFVFSVICLLLIWFSLLLYMHAQNLGSTQTDSSSSSLWLMLYLFLHFETFALRNLFKSQINKLLFPSKSRFSTALSVVLELFPKNFKSVSLSHDQNQECDSSCLLLTVSVYLSGYHFVWWRHVDTLSKTGNQTYPIEHWTEYIHTVWV